MNKKYIIRFLLLAAFIAFIVWIHFVGAKKFMSFSQLKAISNYLMYHVNSHYTFSAITFTAIYFIAVGVSLPAAFLFTVLAGYLFGTLFGALYSTIASTAGALVAFYMVRYGLGEFIQDRYSKQLVTFNKAVHHYGTGFLIAVHFIAIIPFFLINLLAGMTRVSGWTFAWTTAVGLIPVSLVFAFAGSQLHDIKCVADVFSQKVILALILLAIFSFVPLVLGMFRGSWQKFQE